MIGRIEERVDLCDCHPLRCLSDLDDLVARADFAFLQDAQVEAGPSAGCQQSRHPRLVHSNADAVAGDPWLTDLEQCVADPITVADAHGRVGHSLDREVLAELAVDEIGSFQLLLPVSIRFHLVDEDGSLLTAVSSEIALAVSIEIQPPGPTATRHRVLPDPGVDSAAIPVDVARKPDIHR